MNEENKIEEPKENISSNTTNNNNVEQSIDPKPMEEVKIEGNKNDTETKDTGKGKRILVLIFFILVFAFVMGMPYINEYLDKFKKEVGLSDIEKQAKQIEKEQEAKKKSTNTKTTDNEKYTTLTCTSGSTSNDNYTKSITQTFEYDSNNQVISSGIKTIYTFTDNNESYNSLKNECDQNGLKYIEKDGFEYACSYSETEVVIENNFYLPSFKTIKDGSKIIAANAEYKAKISDIKTKLTKEGYSCK